MPTFEANIAGTWTLLEACRARRGGERSSSPPPTRPTARTSELPYREDDAAAAAFPYDVSQGGGRPDRPQLLAHAYELPVAVTRFANIYGGGDLNFSRLVPEAVSAVLDGRRPVIRSDGSPERDFLYVEDAVAAYLAIEPRRSRRAGAGRGASTPAAAAALGRARCVELICEVAGTDVEPDFQGEGNPGGRDRPPVPGLDQAPRALTGWEPQVELREGLSRTLEWYREHPEARAPRRVKDQPAPAYRLIGRVVIRARSAPGGRVPSAWVNG